jgi:nucleoside 2-deoxyribosyltransferase
MVKGYLANGLFSLGDRLVNDMVAHQLRTNMRDLELYVPQENDAINDKDAYASSEMIAKADFQALSESDFLVAVIDGVEIDSGVSAEIGIAYTLGIPIFALYTDVRQQGRGNEKKIKALIEDGTENQFVYRNLFVVGLIKDSGGGIANSLLDLEMLARSVIEYGGDK